MNKKGNTASIRNAVMKISGIILTIAMGFVLPFCTYASESITGSEELPYSGQIAEGTLIKPGSILRDVTVVNGTGETGTFARLSSIYEAEDTIKVVEYIDGINDRKSYENIYGDISENYGEINLDVSMDKAVSYRWMLEDEENSFLDLEVDTPTINLTEIDRNYHKKILRCLISIDVPQDDQYGEQEDYEDIIILDHVIEVFWLPEIIGTEITADGIEIY